MITNKPANAAYLTYQKRNLAHKARKQRISSGTPLPSDLSPPFTLLSLVKLVASLMGLTVLVSWFITDSFLFGYEKPFLKKINRYRQKRNWEEFTMVQLGMYDGTDKTKPIYLAVKGDVFDVSKGERFYGPGGSYHSM